MVNVVWKFEIVQLKFEIGIRAINFWMFANLPIQSPRYPSANGERNFVLMNDEYKFKVRGEIMNGKTAIHTKVK
jgi:hypothetical protein